MWSFGRVALKLPSDEFWSLTMEEFEALVERWEEQQMRWEHRFGVVTSGYVNCKLKEGAEPIKPLAWFGYEDPEDEEYEMTPEQTMAALEALAKRKPKQPKLEPIRQG